MALPRLRALTVVLPLVFLLTLELVSMVVLEPLFGSNTTLRLLVIFLILIAAVIPFSIWVFALIERQQRELVQSAELLRSVTDYAIFLVDPQGTISSWSPGAERVKGYAAEEIIGRQLATFYPPEEVEQGTPEQNLAMAAERGQVEEEGWRVRRDGTRFWANVVSRAIRDQQGTLLGFAHVTRDITERKQTEERIRSLNQQLASRVEELAAANAAITQRNRELDAINTAITSISRALDLDQVLGRIVDAARELVGCRYAALGVADAQGRIVQFITSGITPEQRAAMGPLPQGHGLLGVLITEGQPLRIPNIAHDPRRHGFPPNHPPMTSLLGVPILFQGRPVGDLYLTDKVGGPQAGTPEFSQEDQTLVELLANHAAVAIQNARLYEEVRAARDRLQTWSDQLEQKVAERTQEIERYSKELTTRVLQAQEEERKRIARELHDDTAQSLATLLITLDLLEPQVQGDGAALRSGLSRLGELTRRTLDSVRALSHDLRPTILDDFGLIAALHWFADECRHTFGLAVEVRIEQPPPARLAPEVELALFRIAQEALTNSGKYAEASCAHVILSFAAHQARLVVEDDGKGFDRGRIPGPTRSGGLGLYGMQERAELLGATLELVTAPGQGTRVTVVAPLPVEEEPGVPAR